MSTDISKLTPLQCVRAVFPDASQDESEHLLWNRTGWPCFFNDGSSYQDQIISSLRRYKEVMDSGKFPCELCSEPCPDETTSSYWQVCSSCRKACDLGEDDEDRP